MKLVLIPAGSFMMGSDDGDSDEKPVHKATITRPFYLGTHEVTVGQFRKFVSDAGYKTEGDWRNAGFAQTDDHPVVNVSWNDAVAFCEWLSRKEGTQYRLPTEAQWEYACRAGSTGKFCYGNDENQLGEYAWYDKNSDSKAHPVGEKKPNAWGLYDMHGNVWEWCADWNDSGYYGKSPTDDPSGPATGSSRVYRGGSWSLPARLCRSAFRGLYLPGGRPYFLGLRVSLVPADK
jgi:formylglycine-generating enzyme required for sulfatase activity